MRTNEVVQPCHRATGPTEVRITLTTLQIRYLFVLEFKFEYTKYVRILWTLRRKRAH